MAVAAVVVMVQAQLLVRMVLAVGAQSSLTVLTQLVAGMAPEGRPPQMPTSMVPLVLLHLTVTELVVIQTHTQEAHLVEQAVLVILVEAGMVDKEELVAIS